eukprot:576417-Pyramimonas_sp.AAC.1
MCIRDRSSSLPILHLPLGASGAQGPTLPLAPGPVRLLSRRERAHAVLDSVLHRSVELALLLGLVERLGA